MKRSEEALILAQEALVAAQDAYDLASIAMQEVEEIAMLAELNEPGEIASDVFAYCRATRLEKAVELLAQGHPAGALTVLNLDLSRFA